MYRHALCLCLLLAGAPFHLAQSEALGSESARALVEAIKQAPRGPFSRVRWFCADGSVLPPEPYACAERGGGVQHGELSDAARRLRHAGYPIANLLTDLRVDDFVTPRAFSSLLLERFLMAADDGWLLRGASQYRGALQAENEETGGRQLLLARLADADWLQRHFLLLREGVRWLPHGAEGPRLSQLRQEARALAEIDPRFVPLRTRIHNLPSAEDAPRVRAYAATSALINLSDRYRALADDIEAAYAPAPLAPMVRRLLRKAPGDALLKTLQPLRRPSEQGLLMSTLASAMAGLRDHFGHWQHAELRLQALQLSLLIERHLFTRLTEHVKYAPGYTRGQLMALFGSLPDALYGAGYIGQRERIALLQAQRTLRTRPTVAIYQRELGYLARASAWAARRLQQHFGASIEHFAEIEPKAQDFIPDRLRGTPLLHYIAFLDRLLRDARQLSGQHAVLLGDNIGSGLRPLNPGVAEGLLRQPPSAGEAWDRRAIYLLPQTLAELPPVAGILTLGEGSPLSHVQLLARNLGIPNVAVDPVLQPRLRSVLGQRVRLVVNRAGEVSLLQVPAAQAAPAASTLRFTADLDKLDLRQRELLALHDLRSRDSGRVVGPKAAELGELARHFPDSVAVGLTIPFGVYRQLLDQPMPGATGSVFSWLQHRYQALAGMHETARRDAEEQIRQRLQGFLRHALPDSDFPQRLRTALRRTFGADRGYGVFVRSDTNVEDLPGFSGAGLNLTVPNVVGEDAIIDAVQRVWASPFAARAFAWRQGRMARPEHVYASVLIQLAVPVDKSGVMVTRDLQGEMRGALTLSANEGVGGVVSGDAAETLLLPLAGGEPRLQAVAAAPWRRVLKPGGGVTKLPASHSDRVLTAAELETLRKLAATLPARFPWAHQQAADVEFGFKDGKLWLFQIRPVAEFEAASERAATLNSEQRIALQARPGAS